MGTEEQPWMPFDQDREIMVLVNPHGTRHVGLDFRTGRWVRLWQYRQPQPIGADDATLLRPSDIDKIIQMSIMWIREHRDDQQANRLVTEISRGAKALVLHYAEQAGAR